ncbi:MAG: NAD(P)H-dependent oxidoreductase [Ethanoligenens sp.]|uniref:flavodoxin family protein n=1 Tax=Ethanoligenens sp. TaxID=2099655 RepID=UPI0039EC7FCD
MTSAVIYFSKSGTTATIAKHIAKELDAPAEGIVRIGGGGVLAFFREIAQSLSGKQPNIQPLSLDISSYDRIIIGTPVWAGRVSSPVTSFLAQYGGGIQSAAAFITHGDVKNPYSEVFEQLQTMLGKKLDATFSVASRDAKSGAYDLSPFLTNLRAE